MITTCEYVLNKLYGYLIGEAPTEQARMQDNDIEFIKLVVSKQLRKICILCWHLLVTMENNSQNNNGKNKMYSTIM